MIVVKVFGVTELTQYSRPSTSVWSTLTNTHLYSPLCLLSLVRSNIVFAHCYSYVWYAGNGVAVCCS